jgi:hypothetical protein
MKTSDVPTRIKSEGRKLELIVTISANSATALTDAALKPAELLEYAFSPRRGIVASRPATSAMLLNPRYATAITELWTNVEYAVRCRPSTCTILSWRQWVAWLRLSRSYMCPMEFETTSSVDYYWIWAVKKK